MFLRFIVVSLRLKVLMILLYFAVTSSLFSLISGSEYSASSSCPIDDDVVNLDPMIPLVQNNIIDQHNCLRSHQNASNMLKMVWNSAASKLAQDWANKCQYKHDEEVGRNIPGMECGQNIAQVRTGTPYSWDRVIQMWYDEIIIFTFGKGANTNGKVGHYTQIAWATTWQCGCGFKNCGSFYFYVCDYCPAGNVDPDIYNPYKPGPPCAVCKDSCEGQLCTNSCPFTNDWGNEQCDAMVAKCSNDKIAINCKASCNCKGKIY